jgi:hypothetical protein
LRNFIGPTDVRIAGKGAQQRRNMRLLDAEHGARLCVRQPAPPGSM